MKASAALDGSGIHCGGNVDAVSRRSIKQPSNENKKQTHTHTHRAREAEIRPVGLKGAELGTRVCLCAHETCSGARTHNLQKKEKIVPAAHTCALMSTHTHTHTGCNLTMVSHSRPAINQWAGSCLPVRLNKSICEDLLSPINHLDSLKNTFPL